MTATRRRAMTIVGVAATALVVAALAWGTFLWVTAEGRIDRRSIDAINERGTDAQPDDPAGPDQEQFLVVGSDSRQGLTEQERRELVTGDAPGGRADTILLVQVPASGKGANAVSFPRDLRVEIPGHGADRINAALELGGPDALVAAVEGLLHTEIDHYVEVSIPAFLTIVDAVGPVEVCLDEPLRDPKSGADLAAGCQELDAQQALSYVRSRQGSRGDLRRIDRQQRFIAALLDEATSARSLLDPARLYRIVTEVADSLTTDDSLGIGEIRTLAGQVRDITAGDVTTATIPAWADQVDGVAYLIPYRPGVEALAAALDAADPPRPQNPEPDRAQVRVHLWSAGNHQQAARVESVLFYAGFQPRIAGTAPETARQDRTVVYHPDGRPSPAASWVASILGAPVRPLPDGITAPDADVIVVTGSQAGT